MVWGDPYVNDFDKSYLVGRDLFIISDREIPLQSYKVPEWTIMAVYSLPEGSTQETLWTKETLIAIRDMEKEVKALDEYMKCLCALDFRSCRGYVDEVEGLKPEDVKLEKRHHITPEREKMAQVMMKVPVMNNMAQCLIK